MRHVDYKRYGMAVFYIWISCVTIGLQVVAFHFQFNVSGKIMGEDIIAELLSAIKFISIYPKLKFKYSISKNTQQGSC